jgi:hypothetical protein
MSAIGVSGVSFLWIRKAAAPMKASIARAFDVLQGPRLFEFFWHFLVGVSRLTEPEIKAASLVLGKKSIRYHSVRVAEGRLLTLIFKFGPGRAFTTFHTVNLPRSGGHTREHLELLIHELVHVYQFERIGTDYIFQALRAQKTDGYFYDGWPGLNEWRANGKYFKDYNREQQGQIAQDYQKVVIEPELPLEDPVRVAYEPFIAALQAGQL